MMAPPLEQCWLGLVYQTDLRINFTFKVFFVWFQRVNYFVWKSTSTDIFNLTSVFNFNYHRRQESDLRVKIPISQLASIVEIVAATEFSKTTPSTYIADYIMTPLFKQFCIDRTVEVQMYTCIAAAAFSGKIRLILQTFDVISQCSVSICLPTQSPNAASYFTIQCRDSCFRLLSSARSLQWPLCALSFLSAKSHNLPLGIGRHSRQNWKRWCTKYSFFKFIFYKLFFRFRLGSTIRPNSKKGCRNMQSVSWKTCHPLDNSGRISQTLSSFSCPVS